MRGRCLSRVKRVTLAVCPSLPVYSQMRTWRCAAYSRINSFERVRTEQSILPLHLMVHPVGR